MLIVMAVVLLVFDFVAFFVPIGSVLWLVVAIFRPEILRKLLDDVRW